jgi:alpha-galactosidase
MKYVADKVHNLGLKFGIYSSAGIYTCGRYPGSLGYEKKDAQVWAEWGVDYLKYDNCFNQGQSGTPQISFNRYKVMSDALNATGRPILYSICNWGNDRPFDWAFTIANSWRMSGDIYGSCYPYYILLRNLQLLSILRNVFDVLMQRRQFLPSRFTLSLRR